MTSKLTITRARLEKIKSWRETYGAGSNVMLPAEEAEELARMALAAMDSEPHTDDELSNLLWFSQEATCHSDPNYFCEFQRLATPGLIAWIIRELQERRKADSEPVAIVEPSDYVTAAQLVGEGPARKAVHELYEGALRIGDKLYRHAQPAPVIPTELHPDTQKLVIDFCTALAEKLYKAQLKYGYDADWKQDGWPSQCQAHFHQHVAKGDPRDVAAYCAFMWYHGWKTEAAQPAPVVTFYRDGIEAAANYLDQQRKAYDSEHGWSDPDTGAFEFGNDAQREYSSTLEELAEGIRGLHPNAGNSPVIPNDKIKIT